MSHVRLILALHDHQPVGNFDGVFEQAYRTSYLPFLDVLEGYPEIPFVLHTSGPLLEWLVDHRPDYIARLKTLVAAGRVEILGGGFFEPILTMIPYRDRVGQIRSFSHYLEEIFPTKVRGMWVPERVWEQQLVSAIVAAGIEYTVLDDFHFASAGCSPAEIFGYYLSEDEGRLLKIFPGSETLRYAIPFQEPHATYLFLKDLAERKSGSTVVFADDGEKFGSWPKTFDHVYTHGWLRHFCDMLLANRDWLETTTFGRAVDSTLPLGKIYLRDCSYREMTEWALSTDAQNAYEKAAGHLGRQGDAQDIKRFFHAGGFWRNFKARYSECDEMYTRMLAVSNRLEAIESTSGHDPDYLEAARQELYRGQCNCPYWHGSFGGLYLPHLRNAIYRGLIAADTALDQAEGRTGPWVRHAVGDFNLDARQEVRIENDHLVALFSPAQGGHLYELDVRESATNVLATLNRRPEAYHAKIVAAAKAAASSPDRAPAASQGEATSFKQPGLDRLLIYDTHPRKALVDHFYPVGVTLDDLVAGRPVECGDFVTGTYFTRVQHDARRVAVIMERPGRAGPHEIRIKKSVELEAGKPALSVRYDLDDLPRDTCVHFAVEINLAAMAGHARDRYYADPDGDRLGPLDAQLDRLHTGGLSLTDEWLDLRVALTWTQSASLWCFPIETVSQSEGGFEAVYQSSVVLPHWHVTADETGHWEVVIGWSLSRSIARVNIASPRAAAVVASMPS
ncbi:MAG: alpha-amylase/4-alpha-glucanotransferase domain-containing protein [Isosphaeraceae bacterium]